MTYAIRKTSRLTLQLLAALQAAGGNAALALLLTVVTNLGGIFTMPFVLCALLGTGSTAVALSPRDLLGGLLRTILAPLLAGVAARTFVPGVPIFRSTDKIASAQCALMGGEERNAIA